MSGLTVFGGIDGGGSKTLAVVVDAEGRERGRGTAASSNYAAVGLQRAIREIHAAVTAALDQAGGALPLGAAWIGLSGVDRPGDRDALLPHLHDLAATVRLTNDADLVLSALPGARGVAVIAGTGSIVLGRDASGATVRAGGWGHVIGDEGSGYELGRAALQAAARAADGRGPETALLGAIVDRYGLSDPSEMIDRVYHRWTKAEIARIASLVFALRGADPVARSLVDEAARELALGVVTVAGRLSFADGVLPLALGGGLLLGEDALRESVVRRVRRRHPVGIVALADDPALSAARAATDLSDVGDGIGSLG